MSTLELGGLISVALALEAGAAVGMCYVAGFHRVELRLGRLVWWWLPVTAGFLAVSFLGYYLAGKGIYEADHGPGLPVPQLSGVVLAGFGGFLSHGGDTLDRYALRSAGCDEQDASVRVIALAGLEHGVLGLIATVAGITAMVESLKAPPLDVSLPWAVLPLPGFLLGFWLAGRYVGSMSGRPGWRGRVGDFLRAVCFIRRLFGSELVSSRPAAAGMGMFWMADMMAVWAAMAGFGFKMNLAQLVLGVGTGMVFTRRTGPLGGSGVLMLTLAASLWYSGAPLSAAVVGVFCYRIATWLPLPVTLAQLPMLRALGRRAGVGEPTTVPEPALPPRPSRQIAPPAGGLSGRGSAR